MRKMTPTILGLGLCLVAGCPGTMPTGPDTLAGNWEVEGENGTAVLTFNSSSVLTQIAATANGGQMATLTISNSTTTIDGNDVTIVVPLDQGNRTFMGTLSDDGNTLSGMLSETITLGDNIDVTIPGGDLTLTREGTGGGGDDDPSEENVGRVFTAMLSGDNEVPPVTTDTSGDATFTVTETGIDYVVNVAGGTGITMAHIHMGAAGENGGVVFTLFVAEDTATGIDVDGELASGTIAAADLSGALENMALNDLITEMIADAAYVNVHSVANPSGEVRGQIMADEGNGGGGGGDAENGEALVTANCAACHGADGASGFAPNIQGQSAANIMARTGGDGGHPEIELTEQEVLDVEAYLGSFGGS